MGVINNLGLLIRHPQLIPIVFGYVRAVARNDTEGEIKWRRKVRMIAEQRGKTDKLDEQWPARDAELLLKSGHIAEARKEFAAILERHKGARDQERRHLILFAHYYISMIDVEPLQADYWARVAEQEGVSSGRWTTIPSPMGNLMAKEWDAEIEAITALDRKGKL